MPSRRLLQRFIVERRGSTAIEYLLLASLLGVAIFGGLSVTGADLSSVWDRSIISDLNDALDGDAPTDRGGADDGDAERRID